MRIIKDYWYTKWDSLYFSKVLQGVHCDIIESKYNFWGEKSISQA